MGDYEEVETQIERLKSESTEADEYWSSKIQERISRLAYSIGIIFVGAATEVEMVEKKHRIEDALEAVRSAQVDGVVPGGGATLLRISRSLLESEALS